MLSFDDELELLNRLKKGDSKALEEIYALFFDRLYHFSVSILEDDQLARDVIQDVFLILWTKRKSIVIHNRLTTYLHAIAKYNAFKKLRQRKLEKEFLNQVDVRMELHHQYTPLEVLENKQMAEKLATLVQSLPEKCQQVFRLSKEQFKTHKEIAAEMGISPKTVENHLTKAFKQLRSSFKTLLTILTVIFINF